MQGGRGRGDPFAGFGDMPSLFGGRDPFDDPFFTHPLGGMMQPSPFGHAGSPFMSVSPFESSFFGPSGSPFMDAHAPIMHEHRQSLPTSSRGLTIEELNSEDENEEQQPYVEHQDDGPQGRELKQKRHGDRLSIMHDAHSRPQAHSFTFQSSTVTYGGSNGAYYTSSTTRRAGSDGLRFEEHKEADSATSQAAHRLSRGIHNKGHTVSRHLNSDGRVDTMQMLHNINEDELAGFEDAWKGKTGMHLPSCTSGTTAHEGSGEPSRGGRALPSTEKSHAGGRRRSGGHAQSSKARRH